MQTVHLFDCIIISVDDGKSAAAFHVVNSNTEKKQRKHKTKRNKAEEKEETQPDGIVSGEQKS